MEEKAGTSPVPVILTKFQILDSFLLEPLFIIGVLVLTVVIVIIISHFKNRKNECAAAAGEAGKTVAFTDKNLQTVTVLLDNIGDSIEMGELNECSELPGIAVIDEDGMVTNRITTIIPQKDFRDFPRNEIDQRQKRRHIMALNVDWFNIS